MVAPVNPEETSINIELGEKEAEGIYSNLVLVSHSPHEFVIDFARLLPGLAKAKIASRIIIAPTHMAALIQTLKENLENYERTFGAVRK